LLNTFAIQVTICKQPICKWQHKHKVTDQNLPSQTKRASYCVSTTIGQNNITACARRPLTWQNHASTRKNVHKQTTVLPLIFQVSSLLQIKISTTTTIITCIRGTITSGDSWQSNISASSLQQLLKQIICYALWTANEYQHNKLIHLTRSLTCQQRSEISYKMLSANRGRSWLWQTCCKTTATTLCHATQNISQKKSCLATRCKLQNVIRTYTARRNNCIKTAKEHR